MDWRSIGTERLVEDGAVVDSGKPVRVFTVHIVSPATALHAILYNGTSTSGTAYAQFDGTASSGVTINFQEGLYFPDGCYLDYNTAAFTGGYITIACKKVF